MIAIACTLIICATAIACAWILADRWYAHRDRAEQRMARDIEQAMQDFSKATQDMASRAGERIDAHIAKSRADIEKLGAVVERHEATLQAKGWGRH
jgi:ferritin-like metal-binding protein YciE